jgi:cellulose synthase/poly-beta-1,6-N-acetylglucosamine synthase-like glycosyltransferase
MINAYPTISQAENCLSSSTSQDAPLLSIIVPNYNHARFLPERFASIRRQTFTDYELIVLDDASTDDSVEVIRKELTGIPHQLISNEQNSGSPCNNTDLIVFEGPLVQITHELVEVGARRDQKAGLPGPLGSLPCRAKLSPRRHPMKKKKTNNFVLRVFFFFFQKGSHR